MAANLEKVQRLRALMKESKIDAFIIPTADAHISEYVSEHDKRRAYISEFTGSAGSVLVTANKALLWTDARYFLQADKELQSHWSLMKQGNEGVPSMQQWCVENLSANQVVSFDPFLLQANQFDQFRELFEEYDLQFTPLVGKNLIDQVWAAEQPPLSSGQIRVHTMDLAGEAVPDKIARIQKKMTESKSFALLLVALDEVAWLLNLRGNDICFNPVFLSYAVILQDGVHFFVDASKFQADVKSTLPANIVYHPYEEITTFLATLNKQAIQNKKDKVAHKIWVDSAKSNYATFEACGFHSLEEKKQYIISTANPVTLMKSIKNEQEIAGMKAAHIRDGAAVVKFLAWFEQQYSSVPTVDSDASCHAASKLNEFLVAEKLEQFRSEQDKFLGLSFDTISSIGPNGAIVHYKPSETSSSPIVTGQVYLLDSGGQYLDGTTDITRTFYIPSPERPVPTDFQIDMNTRVLQGHIDLAVAVFPANTMGPSLDCFARRYLWEAGTNFAHGTSHGVGAALNVHEGPCGIRMLSPVQAPASTTAIQAGMILSNEPGYYHTGEFGTRIENLVVCVPKEVTYKSSTPYFTFENLTMVPLDRQLIKKEALSQAQLDFVNTYSQQCYDRVLPLVKDDPIATAWLQKNTQPL